MIDTMYTKKLPFEFAIIIVCVFSGHTWTQFCKKPLNASKAAAALENVLLREPILRSKLKTVVSDRGAGEFVIWSV